MLKCQLQILEVTQKRDLKIPYLKKPEDLKTVCNIFANFYLCFKINLLDFFMEILPLCINILQNISNRVFFYKNRSQPYGVNFFTTELQHGFLTKP